ncbi:somatostatin receptor type 3 [Alosa pseudoharengus]|uniref:somatostatin receptor type 3 n=1 Tax=Alosa pseudoharengus TaxID=34774 RepID=UPI003F8BADAA
MGMSEAGAVNGSGGGNASGAPRSRMDWDTQQLLVPTLDALIMLTGVTGHSLVIFVLARRRRRRRVGVGPAHGTDTLLLALSASDLLLLTCLPFHTAAIALGTWPFGDLLCKCVSFLGVACNAASVFTLSALAVSRYLTVVHPAWAFGGRWRAGRWLGVAAALLWVPACALAAPQFAIRAVGTVMGPVHCFAFLSDQSQLVYSVALFLVAFALPLAVIVLMYAKIYCFLRRTSRRGRAPQLERYQSQVTQTSALLVLVFTVCWLPSYVLMFLLVGARTAGSPHYRAFAIFARLLASSSTVANPVLYVFMSHKFRQELLGLSWHRSRDCKACWDYCPLPGRDTVQPFNPVELETPPPHG